MLTDKPQIHGAKFDEITSGLRARRHTRTVVIEAVIVLVLAVGGGLLAWGGNFAGNMVRDQLGDQKIYFPEKGSPGFDAKTFPGIQQYAGKLVNSGPMAKAYANEYIAVHLAETNNGKTYSETSNESRANPNDQELAGKVQTLFRGETLRGLLLYAWGWSVVGSIATIVSWAAFAGAAVVLMALLYGLFRPQNA